MNLDEAINNLLEIRQRLGNLPVKHFDEFSAIWHDAFFEEGKDIMIIPDEDGNPELMLSPGHYLTNE